MYLLIVLLPLVGAALSGFLGRYLGKNGAAIVTITGLLVTTISSYIAFYEIGLCGQTCYIEVMPWIDSGMLHVNWGFMFDTLTVVMLITVTTVSLVVHIYAVGYMGEDPHVPRFMSYLSLFTFFMLILVTADNFIQMFVGWEGVGLCSYLLISFWHTRIEANQAAMKAMIVNRIGDFGLALGISAIYLTFKSINFATVFATAPYLIEQPFIFLNMEVDILTVICLLLFVGAMGKSAQIGLHTWLPDAMEGPTPVSALIHAATMVTAGVFMIIRCSPIFELAPTALIFVTLIGAMTAFFAATTGLVQNDLKKVIAYSTCSQLGYMVFACGISSYSVSVFHLMNHAFFKALLFLGAGCVIHSVADEQDMRKMGGLLQLLPFTYVMMVIGSLSLMGFPFLTGFYSKDVILELAYAKYTVSANFAYWLGVISAFFTAFYSFRLLYLTFITKTNAPKHVMEHVHDAPPIMALPLLILAFGSIFVGYLTKDMMIGLGTDFWGSSIYIADYNITMLESEFIPASIKLIPVIFSICGAVLSVLIYTFGYSLLYHLQTSYLGRKVYWFLSKKWYFDNIYNYFVARNFMTFGYQISFKLIDRGFVELFGPYGISKLVANLSQSLSRLQTGLVYHYAFVMLVGLMIIITVSHVSASIPSLASLAQLYFIFLVGFVLAAQLNLLKSIEAASWPKQFFNRQ